MLQRHTYHGSLSAGGETFESFDALSFVKDLGEKEDAVFGEKLDGAVGKAHQYSRPIRSARQTGPGISSFGYKKTKEGFFRV